MAAWRDLEPRVAALTAQGLRVDTEYKGDGLPKWLAPALGGCDAYIVNVKGVALDDTLCIVRLAQLEKLLADGADPVEALLAQERAALDKLLAELQATTEK